MSEHSRDRMVDKIEASEAMAKDYDHSASVEEITDRKLAEKTRVVSKALRDRAAYIKERLNG